MANKYLDDVGLTHLWTKIKDYVLANSNKYTLPTATTSTLGGVKLGSDTVQTIAATTVSSTSNRTYAIQTNSSGQLVVNVPWSNSNTTLSGLARCTTAAATAAKTATMPGFSLSSGQYILLRTTVTNSATSNVTLSVNSTTAKPVKIGTSSTTPNASNFPAGDYLANYDGTNWVLTRIYLTDNNTHRSWRVNSNVVSGLSSTTTDVNLVAGDNVTISASGTDITFAATDTKYSNATTTAAGLMSATDKDKLDKIASGAEVNVQSDWSVTDTNSDAYIKNKPTIPTVNNGTLTIQGNGTAASTFTANQSGNTTLNIKGSGGTTVTKSANNEITISTGTIPTGGAASKNVDTSISAASTSTNLPTSQAVAAFVEGKGYKTTDNNTATAADNILDGSNSGTEITYKPYNAQQSKLSFDTSTTNPTRTDRLNLNGYLYATKLYSGGSEVLTSHQSIYNLTLKGAGTTVTTFNPNNAANSLDIVAGSNVTITPDATNKKITIAATDTDTHHTAYNYVGAKDTNSNATTTNGNTYLKLYENGTKRSQFLIKGNDATSVTSDASGNITISSQNSYQTPTYITGLQISSASTGALANLYVPVATSSQYGVVKSSTTGTTANRDYNVQVNTDGTMKVNVPWTDNNSATAADNILDGSNSGTAITYAPYSSSTATSTWVGTDSNAGKLYLGTVNPSKTTRLNYNGYLYATKLYSGGSEALTLAGAQTVTGLKTFSNANFGSVKVKRTDTNAASIIFENSNGTLGSIGMTQTANGGLVRWNTDTSKSYKVWDSGNHGANSGLDADKLDGQDGSYYLNYNNFTNRPSIPTVPTVANGNIVVGNSSSALSDSGVSLTTLQEIASGATNTYVAKNQAESFTLASASVTSQPAEGTKAIRISSFKDINDAVVTASALKVGDIILLTAVDEPDWFVATVGSGFVTLAELETRKIDLDPYVTSVKVGTTSYSPSSGVVTLPAYPTSLKNPNAVTIQAGGATISTYDGSAAKTFNIAASTTAGAFTISDGTTTKTVQLAGTFTDNNTKNTAGATDTSSKIYLVGATSQNDNPQTYSDNEVYATSGVLTTKKTQVGGGSVTMEYDSTYKALKFVF